jgi:hypothetical protein
MLYFEPRARPIGNWKRDGDTDPNKTTLAPFAGQPVLYQGTAAHPDPQFRNLEQFGGPRYVVRNASVQPYDPTGQQGFADVGQPALTHHLHSYQQEYDNQPRDLNLPPPAGDPTVPVVGVGRVIADNRFADTHYIVQETGHTIASRYLQQKLTEVANNIANRAPVKGAIKGIERDLYDRPRHPIAWDISQDVADEAIDRLAAKEDLASIISRMMSNSYP